ncbi:MAG TPA: glycosyltransferase family 39 protein [Chthoniobacterales bacterium]
MSLFSLDEAVFRFVNGTLSNPVFDAAMPWLSGPPPIRIALLLAAIVFAWKGGKRGWLCLAAFALAAVLGEELVYSPLKNLLARPRPYEALNDVNLLVGRGRPNHGIPSSHAGNCFAAVVVFGFYYRRSLQWILPLALAVSFARVYVGAHYPSDVVLGALLGSGIGGAVLLAFRFVRIPAFEKLDYQRLGEFLIGFVLLANLIFLASGRLQLSEDEAYQWLWAKHLDWSYYSKPPLIAWMQFLSTSLWGDSEFGVRFFAPLCIATASWLMLRLLVREANARVGFIAVLIAAATPLLAGCGILFLPDSLAIVFWTAGLVAAWRAIQQNSTAAWLCAGVAIGLGLLSKQVAFAQIGCLLTFFALHPPARGQLRRPAFYAALLIAALCLVPVLVWNTQHDWAMASHIGSRSGLGNNWTPSPLHFVEFIGAEFALITPIFFVGITAAAITLWRNKQRSPFALYLFCMSTPLLLGCALYSLVARVQPNWIVPAILPAIALMVVTFEPHRDRLRGWLAAGVGVGVLLVVLAHETMLIRRLTGYALPPKLDPLRRVLGWKSAAETVEAERRRLAAEGNPVFVIGAHYGITSLLTFYTPGARQADTRTPFIYSISSDEPRNQFYFWPGYSDRKGQDAIFVEKADAAGPPPLRLREEFESVTDLGLRAVYDKDRGEIRRIQLFACRRLR